MQRKWLLVLVIAIVWAAGILTLLNYAYPRADGSLIRFYPAVYFSSMMFALAVLGPILALLLSCALFILRKRPAVQSVLMILLTLVGIVTILTAAGPIINLATRTEHLDAVTGTDGEYRVIHSGFSGSEQRSSGTVIELWLYRCDGWRCEQEYRHWRPHADESELVVRDGLAYLLVNGEQVYPASEGTQD
jgi:hypothetical protein